MPQLKVRKVLVIGLGPSMVGQAAEFGLPQSGLSLPRKYFVVLLEKDDEAMTMTAWCRGCRG